MTYFLQKYLSLVQDVLLLRKQKINHLCDEFWLRSHKWMPYANAQPRNRKKNIYICRLKLKHLT